MASGKSTKKTPLTGEKSSASSKKSAVAGTKSSTAGLSKSALGKEEVTSAAAKTSRKAQPVVKVASGVETRILEPAPKTMAAAANQSVITDGAAGVEAPVTQAVRNGSYGSSSASAPTREEIAHRAYTIWAARGFAHGSADEDWAQAETELLKTS